MIADGTEISLKTGEALYQQGSESAGVYLILHGIIEISRLDGEIRTSIARLGEGQLLGEVSVIEGKPHSVTAAAAEPTTLLFIPAEAFQRSFKDPLVRFVVRTLSERLRTTISSAKEKKSIDTGQQSWPSADTPYPNLPHIEGESRLVASHLLTLVPMRQFPFRVGRILSGNDDKPIINEHSLMLPLFDVPELGDGHFEVLRRDGRYCVRDLGTPAGTTVNGVLLSRYSRDAIALLDEGTNSVIAGGPESPVRFTIRVP